MRTLSIRSILVAAFIAVALAPLTAQATLYKWIDDNGIVNYGDAPPGGPKNATPVDEASSSLSVYPGMTKDELARARDQDTQYRIQQLQRENAELRAQAYTYAPPPPPAYDSQQLAYDPLYVPLVVTRRAPPRLTHFPVRGAPVQKTRPFRGMSAEHPVH